MRSIWKHCPPLATRQSTPKCLSQHNPTRLLQSGTLRRTNSTTSAPIDVDELLSKPTWSVSSLLPPANPKSATLSTSAQAPQITSAQLHHLLRLSALPPPQDAADEARMLDTLSAQLHFVRQVQQVDTAGVAPLRGLRDETARGRAESVIGVEDLAEALAREEVRGKFHKRIRRREGKVEEGVSETREEGWNVLETAGKKVGRYFVVDGVKDR